MGCITLSRIRKFYVDVTLSILSRYIKSIILSQFYKIRRCYNIRFIAKYLHHRSQNSLE